MKKDYVVVPAGQELRVEKQNPTFPHLVRIIFMASILTTFVILITVILFNVSINLNSGQMTHEPNDICGVTKSCINIHLSSTKTVFHPIHVRHPATTEAPIDLGENDDKMKISFNHTDEIGFAALQATSEDFSNGKVYPFTKGGKYAQGSIIMSEFFKLFPSSESVELTVMIRERLGRNFFWSLSNVSKPFQRTDLSTKLLKKYRPDSSSIRHFGEAVIGCAACGLFEYFRPDISLMRNNETLGYINKAIFKQRDGRIWSHSIDYYAGEEVMSKEWRGQIISQFKYDDGVISLQTNG